MTITDKSGAQVRVELNEAQWRYEIYADNEFAGFAEFTDRGSQRVIYHTEIDPLFGGRGLATILTEQELGDVRNRGMHVVPVCPVVAAYVKKNDGWGDIVDPVTPEILRELGA